MDEGHRGKPLHFHRRERQRHHYCQYQRRDHLLHHERSDPHVIVHEIHGQVCREQRNDREGRLHQGRRFIVGGIAHLHQGRASDGQDTGKGIHHHRSGQRRNFRHHHLDLRDLPALRIGNDRPHWHVVNLHSPRHRRTALPVDKDRRELQRRQEHHLLLGIVQGQGRGGRAGQGCARSHRKPRNPHLRHHRQGSGGHRKQQLRHHRLLPGRRGRDKPVLLVRHRRQDKLHGERQRLEGDDYRHHLRRLHGSERRDPAREPHQRKREGALLLWRQRLLCRGALHGQRERLLLLAREHPEGIYAEVRGDNDRPERQGEHHGTDEGGVFHIADRP